MAESSPPSLLSVFTQRVEMFNALSLVAGAFIVILSFIRHIPGFHELENIPIDFIKHYWNKNTQTMKISSDDSLYYIVMEWVGAHKDLSTVKQKVAAKDLGPYVLRLKRVLSTGLPSENNPVFTPDSGSFSFEHSGQRICFTRIIDRERPGETKECVEFSTRSTTLTLVDLINQIDQEHKQSRRQKTEVYRALYDHKDKSVEWRLVAAESRNIETIVLAPGTKKELVADLETFLQTTTAKWYSDVGIPYRRGYLFKGPPGTGKTSLCKALATKFNLPVYQLALGSTEMNDSCLAELFDSVPSKCLLLCEDIDAVGLANRMTSPAERRDGVTLSGLLNLIDGIGAPEGRILIMTTNYAANLDTALVRPGRIEKTYDFPMADKDCAERLFGSLLSVKGEEGEQLAQEFAKKIPDGVFSPADLQGYLITKRDCPHTAVEGVEAWVKATVAAETSP